MRIDFSTIPPIREVLGLSAATADHSTRCDYEPLVLRNFFAHWPLVQTAKNSLNDLRQKIQKLDTQIAVDAIMLAPECDGRIFYNDAMDGFNFLRNRVTISSVLDQIFRYAQFHKAPAVAVQSALMSQCLPQLLPENAMPFLDASVEARIWLGNQITTPIHIDGSDNIAGVVCGQRRFVLFPPEQIGNLYIGPLDFAPTPSPMSLVNLKYPELEKFPRFAEALKHARTAILEPGDAIFIPNLWWHHVESLEKINILINYWWGGANFSKESNTTPYASLMQCLLNFKTLPPEQRAAWGSLFQHYVFNPEDPAAHIPEQRRGILARSS